MTKRKRDELASRYLGAGRYQVKVEPADFETPEKVAADLLWEIDRVLRAERRDTERGIKTGERRGRIIEKARRIKERGAENQAKRRKGGQAKAARKRAANVDRDRRIHDASSRGVLNKTIARDERISESAVSRVLRKPRP
jgi:hypothetical protein